MYKIKKNKFLNIFFSISLLFFTDVSFTKEQNYKDQFQKLVLDFRYILGPGDILKVSVLNLENMQYDVQILPDGTVNIPRIGSVYLSGLNLEEARENIKISFEKILNNPLIFINLTKSRPIRINVIGEVQRPGIYSLTQSETSLLSNSDGGESDSINFSGWPTVIDAIQKSGGVTSSGDLKKVTLKRSLNKNSKREELKINYWQAIIGGDNFTNPPIYDGDIIKIPIAKNINPEKKLQISQSNLAPSTISVVVIGEVVNPGTKKIRSSSPLSEAIFSAGGLTKKANKTNIALYRLEDNGTINFKKLKYKPSLKVDNDNNPTLKDRDVLLVGKNAWAKFNSSLDTIVDPIAPILNGVSIFKLLSD